MIAALRAFAWLRYRFLVNGLRGGKRRDSMEGLSRFAAVAVPALVLVFFVVPAAGLGALAFTGGRLVATGEIEARVVLVLARLLLLIVLGILLLAPLGASLGTTPHGSIPGLTRFLLLPIAPRMLHFIEVAAGAASPGIAFLFPAFVLLPVGLMAGGKPAAAIAGLAAGGGFLLVLVCLAGLISFLLQWLLRDRRQAEIVTVIFLLAVSLGGMSMSFLVDPDMHAQGSAGGEQARGRLDSMKSFLNGTDGLSWTLAIPAELYARALGWAIEGSLAAAWAAGALLLIEAMAVFLISGVIHRKILDSPGTGRRRRKSGRSAAREVRLPGVSPAAAAVALVQVRTALRTVRGRLAVFLTTLPVILMMAVLGRRMPGVSTFLLGHGYMLLSIGVFIGMLSLQSILLNQFATDRAGLTLQFVSPIHARDLILGKAAGGAALLSVALALFLAAALVMAPGGPALLWAAALVGGLSSYILMAPAAAVLSALFPKPADLGKIGSAGNPHAAAASIGLLLSVLAAIPPTLVMGIANYLLASPLLALLLMLLWTLLACALALPLSAAAARVLEARRENLAQVAQGR